MRSAEFSTLLRESLDQEGIDASDALLEKATRFAELLREWNATHNLTGDDSLAAVAANIVDSLVPVGFVEAPASLLDVGTGSGFPGLMLALAWPECATLLCEPRNKRAAFLRFAAIELGLQNVRVQKRRVEEIEEGVFELISSRAVSDTAMLLKLTAKVRGASSRFLFYKGSAVEEELEAVGEEMEAEIVERPPRRYLYLRPKRAMISKMQEKGE